jgi:GntR family transcriptional regulator
MSTPLHGRVGEIRTQLLDLVESLPEGAMLPPERDLARRWHVARMTLRRAMDELVDDGLLIKRQGAGTFTARPKVARRMVMTSFSQEMRRRGMTPSSRILDLRRHRAEPALSRQLRIPSGDPVVSLIRLRLADDVPMALENITISERYVPGLTVEDLAGSWYELLRRRYGIELVEATTSLEPVLPDPASAQALQIPVDQPCMSVRGSSRDARGRVLEMVHALYRGDRYSVTVEVRQPGRPAPGRRHSIA